jgi:hypothetical protein
MKKLHKIILKLVIMAAIGVGLGFAIANIESKAIDFSLALLFCIDGFFFLKQIAELITNKKNLLS